MEPTFSNGTRLIAWQGSYRAGDLKRGEIVLIQDPEAETLVVKRVIGVGGDEIRFEEGRVILNGKPLDEPYLNRSEPLLPDVGRVVVPPDSVFVMGDNRNHSEDSRAYGPVPLNRVRGRPFLAIWPPSEWGKGQRP